jgi:hypothetical protein
VARTFFTGICESLPLDPETTTLFQAGSGDLYAGELETIFKDTQIIHFFIDGRKGVRVIGVRN